MKVGDKVICINDNQGWLSGEKKLIKDKTYEVLQTNGRDIVVINNDAGWDIRRFKLLDI